MIFYILHRIVSVCIHCMEGVDVMCYCKLVVSFVIYTVLIVLSSKNGTIILDLKFKTQKPSTILPLY